MGLVLFKGGDKIKWAFYSLVKGFVKGCKKFNEQGYQTTNLKVETCSLKVERKWATFKVKKK